MNYVSFTAVQSIFFLLFLLAVWLIVYKIVKAENESVNYNGDEGWNKSNCLHYYWLHNWWMKSLQNANVQRSITGLLWLKIIVTFYCLPEIYKYRVRVFIAVSPILYLTGIPNLCKGQWYITAFYI